MSASVLLPPVTKTKGAEVVVLTTCPTSHATRSGYQLLAEYLPHVTTIQADRKDPAGFIRLNCARLARKMAFSRWYLGGSADLEWRCFRHLKGRQSAIVHYFWADFDLGFLDVYLKKCNHKIVGTFHHCSDTIADVIRFPSRLQKLSAVILMSESQRLYMLQAGVSPNRIHVIPHGVDAQFFVPRIRDAEKPFRVLTVGGYRRDFSRLRKLCVALREKRNISIHVVGPKAAADIFADLPHVQYSHGLSDAQLLTAYQQASCFLMVVENATANNALLEAMACGLPIIADRVGGLPEYVNTDCAFLFDKNDLIGMVTAIKSLQSSRSMQADMAAAARSRACEFDWPTVARATMDVYQSIAS